MHDTGVPQATDDIGFLTQPDGGRIAYRQRPARQAERPGLLFLGGFMSDMEGAKATALDAHAAVHGQGFLRFDYRGHGRSSYRLGHEQAGEPPLGIGAFTADALHVLDTLSTGPQVLVGSSMGGWIMLNVALARPERVAALVGIAAAPDFTEDLMWAAFSDQQRQQLMTGGSIAIPSAYAEEPYRITRHLIEDGRQHLRLRASLPITCPVRLLHGMADADVPWQTALTLADRLTGGDVQVTLIKDGDHRLSRSADLALLSATLDGLS